MPERQGPTAGVAGPVRVLVKSPAPLAGCRGSILARTVLVAENGGARAGEHGGVTERASTRRVLGTERPITQARRGRKRARERRQNTGASQKPEGMMRRAGWPAQVNAHVRPAAGMRGGQGGGRWRRQGQW